jgi:hypothetical protein
LTSQPTLSPPASARRTPAILFVLIAALYLSTLTANYYWDGITFALQIERVAIEGRTAALLFHQNHLLYNALGYLLYRVAHAVGFGIRALPLLQIANALIGAAAVTVFFHLARRATANRYVAIVCSVALAVSAAWWKISTDVDAYILVILFILVCANNLLSATPRWVVAGLALAGAMLMHELAALFYLAAIVAIFTSQTIERKMRFAAWMSALAGTVTIVIYYLCAFLTQSITHPLELVKWATSNPTGKSLGATPVDGIKLLPKVNIDAIIGHDFALFRRQGEWVEFAIALAALVAGLIFVIIAMRKVKAVRAVSALRHCAPELIPVRRQLVPMLVVWVGIYAVFLIFWGPLLYFRAFYTPALALGLGLALSNYHRLNNSWPSGAAAFAVVAFALFNLGFYIGPNMRAGANPGVAMARHTGWNAQTVIYFADHTEADTAFEYFNPSCDWDNLARVSLDRLESEIARTYNQGGSVWLNKGAVAQVDANWLARRASGRKIEVDVPGAPALYVEVLPEK